MKLLASLLTAALLLPAAASAQTNAAAYPNHPVRIVIPFAPGGATDYIARVIAQKLTEKLGQSFIVENRDGAGGVIGSAYVFKSPPDGYTLLIASASYAVNPSLMKLPFDPVKDTQPVINIIVGTTVFAASKDAPFNTLPEMVSYARANPTKLFYSTQGVGSITQVTTEAFLAANHIKISHIPYQGIGPALTALASNQVQLCLPDYGAVRGLAQSGRVKVIAIAGDRRISELPNVPTAAQAGFPGVVSGGSWQGMFAPKNTPRAVVDKLNHTINEILRDPEVQKELASRYTYPVGGTPEAFGKQVQDDIQRDAQVIKAAGIQPQ